jgi:hypothetical protein
MRDAMGRLPPRPPGARGPDLHKSKGKALAMRFINRIGGKEIFTKGHKHAPPPPDSFNFRSELGRRTVAASSCLVDLAHSVPPPGRAPTHLSGLATRWSVCLSVCLFRPFLALHMCVCVCLCLSVYLSVSACLAAKHKAETDRLACTRRRGGREPRRRRWRQGAQPCFTPALQEGGAPGEAHLWQQCPGELRRGLPLPTFIAFFGKIQEIV